MLGFYDKKAVSGRYPLPLLPARDYELALTDSAGKICTAISCTVKSKDIGKPLIDLDDCESEKSLIFVRVDLNHFSENELKNDV